MNKKLLSLAIAAAMAAPGAVMAEAVLYGRVHASIDYADIDGGFKGWGFGRGGFIPGEGRASRLGVKGSEDLGNGLKGVYQVEFGINLTDTNNNVISNSDTISYRNSFVGLSGPFGTFFVGRHDTPHKLSTAKLDLFVDTAADFNGTVGFEDLRADNVIAYTSPKFAGFQFMGAMVAPGGVTAGSGLNINADQINGAWSLAAIYSNGPFNGSLSYEAINSEMFMTTATSQAGIKQCRTTLGLPTPNCKYVSDDYTKWRIGLGILDWNGFTLTGIYEEQSDRPTSQTWTNYVFDDFKKQKLWQIQAGYTFGNSMIKAMYGSADRDAKSGKFDGDRSTWAVAFDHNLSKRTKVYALYTSVDDDVSSDWSVFSLGMLHSF